MKTNKNLPKKKKPMAKEDKITLILLLAVVAALAVAVAAIAIYSAVKNRGETPDSSQSESGGEGRSDADDSDRFRVGDIEYAVTGDATVAVYYYRGAKNADVRVPDTVTDPETGKSYSVTELTDYAFLNAKTNSVTLPKSIKKIGQECFSDHDSLTEAVHVTIYYLGKAEEFALIEVDADTNPWLEVATIHYSED